MWKYIKWFIVVIPIGLLGIATSWLFFIFAWIWSKGIKKFNPFWFWLDDTRFDRSIISGYAKDYQVTLEQRGLTEENFKVAYYWHVARNRMWNLKQLFKLPNHLLYNSEGKLIGDNNIEVIDYRIDNLHKYDGTPVHQNENWVAMARLKYKGQPGQDPYQVNRGNEISKEYSILGTGYIIHRVGKWIGWRYSQCKLVEYKIFGKVIWKGYRTIAIGSNGYRYVDTIKHQGIKPWK